VADVDTLRDRVENLLKDSGNSDWTTAELDDALRLGLDQLSEGLPQRAVTTIDAVADTWEYSLAGVTGLVRVSEVWYPYLSTDEAYKKPHPVRWRMLTDAILLLEPDSLHHDPDAAYDLRVFYTKVQTVAGLDAAASTTLTPAEKGALVIGAAGFAALALSQDRYNQVNIGATTPVDLGKWAQERLVEFRGLVAGMAAMDSASDDGRVGPWKVDKWDV